MSFSEILSQLWKGYKSKPKLSTVSTSNEQQELEHLYLTTKQDFESSFLSTVKAYDFAVFVVEEAIVSAQDESVSGLKEIPQGIVEQLLDITVAANQKPRGRAIGVWFESMALE